MPLHLLPKKSWNVYNTDNIARVRADEEAAAAAEAAEEQRTQEEDAVRRLAILRGEEPPPLSTPVQPVDPSAAPAKRPRDGQGDDGVYTGGRAKRPRKRHGEDDTDFELRLARELQEKAAASRSDSVIENPNNINANAPITDGRGNISLFAINPSPESQTKQPNPEAEADKRRKEERDDPTLRFSNASGRDKSAISKTAPWYQTSAQEVDALVNSTGTNAFGRPDPERSARDAKRLDTADPLALMKQGARKVREVNREREKEREERDREIRRLRKEERREKKERRRKRRENAGRGEDKGNSDNERDSLDGFSLYGPLRRESRKEETDTHRDHSRRHRHRDRHHSDRYGKSGRSSCNSRG